MDEKNLPPLPIASAITYEFPDGAYDSESMAAYGRACYEAALAAQPAASAEPVAWVAADTLNSPHPRCVSSLAYMSQLDRERGREYVPLYAAPVAAQKADDALHRLVAEKFSSGNAIPVERITVTRQEYEAAISQQRKGE